MSTVKSAQVEDTPIVQGFQSACSACAESFARRLLSRAVIGSSISRWQMAKLTGGNGRQRNYRPVVRLAITKKETQKSVC
jgi:hypothetical protein